MKTDIQNALLRVDEAIGDAPFPFERPNEKQDFWILELPKSGDEDIQDWCICTIELLTEHSALLTRFRNAGYKLTLFLETTATLRLEANFLATLGSKGISLELPPSDI